MSNKNTTTHLSPMSSTTVMKNDHSVVLLETTRKGKRTGPGTGGMRYKVLGLEIVHVVCLRERETEGQPKPVDHRQ